MRRHAKRLQLAELDGRVLLAAAVVSPATSLAIEAAKAFSFNGTLYGVGFIGHGGHGGSAIFGFIGGSKVPFKPMGAHIRM